MKKIIAIVAILSLATLASCMKETTETSVVEETTQVTTPATGEMKDGMMKEEGVLVGGAMMVPSKDIIDNAVGSTDHTTLVAAITAAGLVEALKGEGPFTVFAPTNTAFDKLPEGTVETLLKEENLEMLQNILKYHVVSGAFTSSDLTDGITLTTLTGEDITLSLTDGNWYVNGTSKIEIADIISSNGVTYVVDTVVMAPVKEEMDDTMTK